MKQVFICILLISFSVGLYSQQEMKQNGFTQIFYPNGKVSSEGFMRNGKPDGFWKTYYPSGIIKSEGKRLNYLLDSTWVFYSETGDTLEKVNYVLGKRNGYTIGYNSGVNVDPINKGKIISRELYVNDRKEGFSHYYYPNGSIKEETLYSNNKKNGTAREFNEKGIVITILTYKNGYLTDREKINRIDEKGQKQGVWREYDAQNRIVREANYTDNMLNGAVKEFDNNGNIKQIIQYAKGMVVEDKDTTQLEIDIKNQYDQHGNLIYSGSYRKAVPVGVHRMYDSTGRVINSYLFNNDGIKTGEGILTNEGKKEGNWKYYYISGKIRAEGKYTNNQQTGPWKYLFENGSTEQTGSFKQGKYEGLWQWYYTDGSLKREEEFFEGKEEGIYTEYDTTGQIIVNGKYFDGQKEGEWFYKIGDYSEKGKYVADLKDGKWQAFYADGKLKYEGNYIQDNPDGEHDFYYPNGKLKESNYYVMGICEKNWKKYDENGLLVLTITYRDNKEYRINGEKVDFVEGDVKLIQ